MLVLSEPNPNTVKRSGHGSRSIDELHEQISKVLADSLAVHQTQRLHMTNNEVRRAQLQIKALFLSDAAAAAAAAFGLKPTKSPTDTNRVNSPTKRNVNAVFSVPDNEQTSIHQKAGADQSLLSGGSGVGGHETPSLLIKYEL